MSNPKDHFASLDRDLTSEETASLEARQQFVKDSQAEIAYAPHDPSEWKVPPTGDAVLIDGFSRMRFQRDSYVEPGRIMDLKLAELQKYSNRNRAGSKPPPSKSKAAKRSRAKAARKARKQQRRV